jgi:hypothetical protein
MGCRAEEVRRSLSGGRTHTPALIIVLGYISHRDDVSPKSSKQRLGKAFLCLLSSKKQEKPEKCKKTLAIPLKMCYYAIVRVETLTGWETPTLFLDTQPTPKRGDLRL